MRFLLTLLRDISVPEWRLHPWRQGVGVLAVALGVALAFSVHLINESALSEFSSAVRSATGQSDGALQCPNSCDDRVWEEVQLQDPVLAASPVLEIDTYALRSPILAGGDEVERVGIKLMGIDAFTVVAVAPDLMPRLAPEIGERLGFLLPEHVFLNPAALSVLGLRPGQTVRLQAGLGVKEFTVAGSVGISGSPVMVADIAAAQEHFGAIGRLSRIELRLAPGATRAELSTRWQTLPWWPKGARLQGPDDDTQRVSTASRAYRVNLTVLALVALFVGAFLVFSVQALSVAQRTPSLALLGVMGLSARLRMRLILCESMVLGVVGSALGLLLGTAAAWLALHWLAGDLGGGYFPGIAPSLQFSVPAALAFAVLGVLAALMGGWAPALQAQRLAAAQALKGLGGTHERAIPGWAGPALVGVGAALSFAPAWQGMALGAYVAVAFLLLGGIACVPTLVDWLLRRARPQDHALAVLAVGRARHERQAATVAVAGVVASLSLAVALTIMVASFRSGVALWLEQVLPADLYARTATSTAASDGAFLPPEFVEAAATLPGVSRVDAARVRSVVLDPSKPAISLVARPLSEQALQGRRVSQVLPMVAPSSPPVSTVDNTHAALDGYVTEAMEMLYGARPGTLLELPVATIGGSGSTLIRIRVKGVWRDYARQFGAVAIDLREYQALTGDTRINDLAISLDNGADVGEVQRQLREKVPQPALIEFAVPAQIRAISMRIFDRSFAVTYYLQALAIGIGLFGIAASFSAQVLARRKEFGLLSHLGLTRWQIVSIVAGEGAAWTAAGALAGLVLGLAVSAVLVHVVNPQSFHWTMELVVPWDRLGLLCAAVLLAGSLTAALSARTAASADAVRSVKEDW